jgi:SNF2 family DNA or RNA helicase
MMSETETAFQTFLSWSNLDFAPHQLEGVKWCIEKENAQDLEEGRKKGGIIADEMGLGKTVLMLATMSINVVHRTLVVLPQSLLQQWHAEILRTTGHNALIYHKTNKKDMKKSDLENALIVLSTYGTISYKHKTETEPCPLFGIQWNRIICDEAHHIRNSKTTRYLCVRALQSPIWWLMTGTPIHNTPKDIRSLFKLIGIQDAAPETMQQNILRRTKSQVGITIPSLTKTQIFVEWEHDEERGMAKDIHSSLNFLCFPEKSIGWTKMTKGKGAALVSMLRGRQTCNYPRLLQETVTKVKTKYEEEILETPDEEDAPPFSMYEYAIQNGHSKLDAMANHLLTRKRNGNGKIVFCHFTKEIQMMTEILKSNGVDWVGGWTDYVREGISSKSDISTPVLILQIQTGCEGLNLQKQFSEVYFICPHWNPAIEDQAVARCHRIGQEKKVEVFEFVMNSIKPAEVNKKADTDVQTFQYVFTKLGWDIRQSILSYLLPNDYLMLPENMREKTYDLFNRTLNSQLPDQFSLDKYVLFKQNKKRVKTERFFKKHQIEA